LSNVDPLFVASQTGRHLDQKGSRVSNSLASANTSTFTGKRARLALAALLAAASCFLLSALLAAAPASAACPNDVFRTGPSAKLPDCRAYELVTPAYTGGIKPQGLNFSNMYHGFEFDLLQDAGDSLMFNTSGAALSGTPGNGFNDRYRAKRTATGWVTELAGPNAMETTRLTPGPVSDDHEYEFFNAGLNEFNLEPESTLQAPYGGRVVDILQKPGGQYEPIAIGSLGSDRTATGHRITPGATHVIFSTQVPLEPNSSPAGMTTIYDRTPGGPTKVVSLLPDGTAPQSGGVDFLGSSTDGNHVAFSTRSGIFGSDNVRWWVRSNNSVTKEVVRAGGVAIGDELTCVGSGAGTIAYQWLRNGTPIGGATSATYTTTAADAGTAVQCQVEATGSEGTSFTTSVPANYVEPYAGKDFPYTRADSTFIQPEGPRVETGEAATCETNPNAPWEGDPTFSYQWFVDGAAVPGATGSTYSTVPADEGKSLICRLTASNAAGAVVTFSGARAVHPVLPAIEDGTKPTITNLTDAGDAPEAGDELSCSPGTWSESPSFTYQWLRQATPIGGATAGTYTVTAADEGASLQCLVTATADESTQATSEAVVADPQPGEAPPEQESWTSAGMVHGASSAVGDQLYCEGGGWTGGPTLSFQWMRDGAEIPGATEQSYTLVPADLGSVIQCRVIATNAGGSSMGTFAGSGAGAPRFVTANIPNANAEVEGGTPAMTFNGLYGGHLFYSDGPAAEGGEWEQAPADLLSYDVTDGTTTRITDVGDAKFSHVSRDGSHVYFVSPSEIGGEGNAGEPNLYVWNRTDDSTTYIATVEPSDVLLSRNSQEQRGTNLASWMYANDPDKEAVQGLGASDTRSTPDGSVFLFQSSAPLTGFENIEESPEDCLDRFTGGERCPQAYVYDTVTEELTCVSCPPGGGTGSADGFAEFFEWGVISDLNPPNNLSNDGTTVVFESSEDLLPQDGNERKDVYRWKKGEGLALISTGQATTPSLIYGVTPNASDIAFVTTEKLLPHDVNGGTERIYDARVNGGFPPDESTVTEPCTGDACQGNPKAAPEAPSIPSTSLNGGGNVKEKLRCPKGKRKVVRKGKERCIKRKGKHRKGNKQRKSSKQNSAGANRGTNR
jgi:hypothetical protein